ncbi:hypothetical protein F5I97DRAFT_1931883 [Phlebopus sp. FC_14]|nr:hypothetical protein F5I97DRAFT_1931883 [Phlebopus sp. FC_14]
MDILDLNHQTFEDLLKALEQDMEKVFPVYMEDALKPIHYAIITRCLDQDRNKFLESCCLLRELLGWTISMSEREEIHLVKVLQACYHPGLHLFSHILFQLAYGMQKYIACHAPPSARTNDFQAVPSDALLLQSIKSLVDKALLLVSTEPKQDLDALRNLIETSQRDAAEWDNFLNLLLGDSTEAVAETPPIDQARSGAPTNPELSAAASTVVHSDANVDCSRPMAKKSSIFTNQTRKRMPTRTQSMPLLPSSSSSTREMNTLGSLAEVEGEDDDGLVSRERLHPLRMRRSPILSVALKRYETVLKRWPIIITGLIDHLHRLVHDLTMEHQQLTTGTVSGDSARAKALSERIDEGRQVIMKASELKYRSTVLTESDFASFLLSFTRKIPEDEDIYVTEYNAELEELAKTKQNTWFTAPWLFAECYLYVDRSFLSHRTKHWADFDPFFAQKEETFKNSSAAIYQIATTMQELEGEKDKLKGDPEKLLVLFREMIQMCLWGNATDLSLLTHLSPSDIENLQTVGKDAQKARQEFILKDDQEAVWEHIKTLAGTDQRCDFVLDNAGFELFTDFVFADFLVTYTPYFSKVVFHPKLFPWFVSDVTPTDFGKTIDSLLSPTFFPATSNGSPESADHLKQMVSRWKVYIEDGTFALSTNLNMDTTDPKMAEFWNGPWPYWNMKEIAPIIWEWLSKSDLVIFKGDLNYRKLTGDVKWPVTTSFATSIGPLAGSFPLLSLRTNKADVAVGVSQEVADKPRWEGREMEGEREVRPRELPTEGHAHRLSSSDIRIEKSDVTSYRQVTLV